MRIPDASAFGASSAPPPSPSASSPTPQAPAPEQAPPVDRLSGLDLGDMEFSDDDLPPFDAGETEENDPLAMASRPPKRKNSRGGMGMWLMIGGGVTAPLLLIGAVVLAVAMLQGGGGDDASSANSGLPPQLNVTERFPELRTVRQNRVKQLALGDAPLVVCGRSPSPFAVIEDSVMDTRSQTEAGKLRLQYPYSATAKPTSDGVVQQSFSLDSDGRLFAYAYNQRQGEAPRRTTIAVLNTSDSSVAQEFVVSNHPMATEIVHLELSENKRLFAATRVANRPRGEYVVYLWDVATGKELAKETLTRVSPPIFRFHRDGEQLLAPIAERITLHNLATQEDTQLEFPPDLRSGEALSGTLKNLAYSTPGDSVAALVLPNGKRKRSIVVWNAQGRVLKTLPGESEMTPQQAGWSDMENALWHAPDGTGWIVHGSLLVDETSGMPLWMLAGPTTGGAVRGTVGDGALLVTTPHSTGNPACAITVEWPAETLRKIIDPNRPEQNVFRPGQTLAMDVDASSSVSIPKSEITKMLGDEVGDILAQNSGFQVGTEGELVCSISYSEKNGDRKTVGGKPADKVTASEIKREMDRSRYLLGGSSEHSKLMARMELYESKGIIEPVGSSSGMYQEYRIKPGTHVISEAVPGETHAYINGQCNMEIRKKDNDRLLWSKSFSVQYLKQKGTSAYSAETIKSNCFSSLRGNIGAIRLPAFLDEEMGEIALPVVQKLPGAH